MFFLLTALRKKSSFFNDCPDNYWKMQVKGTQIYKIAEFVNQWTTHFYYYFNLFCLNIMSPDAGSPSLGLLRKVLLFSWIWKESKGWSLTLWLPYIDTKNEENRRDQKLKSLTKMAKNSRAKMAQLNRCKKKER